MPEPPAENLTTYFKRDYRSVNAPKPNASILSHNIRLSQTASGTIFVQPSDPKPPRCARFFQGQVSPSLLGGSSAAAALFDPDRRPRQAAYQKCSVLLVCSWRPSAPFFGFKMEVWLSSAEDKDPSREGVLWPRALRISKTSVVEEGKIHEETLSGIAFGSKISWAS